MKKILSVITSLLIASSVWASVAVSPTKIEINANKIRNNYATAAVEVRGDLQKAVRFRIYPEYFVITNESRMNTDVPKGDIHDISSNLRFVPSEFTVPPGKSQKVRVNIANVKALPDGESRAVLFLEDVNPKEMNIPNNAGIGAQLVVKTRVGIPVYVDKGKFTKTGDIEYLKIVREKDGLYTEMKVLSKGNSKIRYTGKVQVIKDKKLVDEYNLDSKVVGDNNYYVAKQKIDTKNIKDAGEYTLRVILSYFDEDNNRKNLKKDAVLNIKNDM